MGDTILALSQNSYEWYSDVSEQDSSSFTQGDIFLDFPAYKVEFSEDKDSNFLEMAITDKENVIVMTQACDLEQNKVSNVVFCPIVDLESAIDSIVYRKKIDRMLMAKRKDDPNFTIDMLSSEEIERIRHEKGTRDQRKSILGNLISGSYTSYYLLDKNNIFSYQVVLLQDSFSMPIKSVQKCLEHFEVRHLKKLNPPYREHLAQAYSISFSRIGLPIDIDRDDIDTMV